MYGQSFQQSMNQQGKVANPARGQLNREDVFFPLSPFAPENLVSLARRLWSSRPASVRPFSTVSLNHQSSIINLVLITRVISPAFRHSAHLFIPSTAIGSVPSLPGHATAYRWRSLPRGRRRWASSPQDSFRFHPMDQFLCASLFPHPRSVCSG